MRAIRLIGVIVILAYGPVFAQSANDTASSTANHARRASHPAGSALDHGPFTPEASRAYQGGGMILEGALGAPAPKPEPAPPGQTPRNMVQPP